MNRNDFVNSEEELKKQHSIFITELRRQTRRFPAQIEHKAKELEKHLAHYNSFDVIANAKVANLMNNPETYKEYSHEGKASYVEYISLLLLKTNFSEGERSLLSQDDWQPIESALKEIFDKTTMLTVVNSRSPYRNKADEELERLIFSIRSHELNVRGEAYFQHLDEVLRKIFTPFNNLLEARVGFGIEDALVLSKIFIELDSKVFNSHLIDSREQIDNLRSKLRKFFRTGEWEDDMQESQELLSLVQSKSWEEVEEVIPRLGMAYAFDNLGSLFSYSVEEISSVAEIPEQRVQAFLEMFSAKFGEVPPEFYIPSEVHLIKEKPFIVHNGLYQTPVPGMVGASIQAGLEKALKGMDAKVWNRYHSHRHNYLLNKSLELIEEALPGTLVERELEYRIEKDGEIQNGELDGLMLYDMNLLLIEVKGKRLTDSARRGAPGRLKRHLEEIIGHAHEQALRAKNFVSERQEVEFIRSDKSTFILRDTQYKKIYLLSISLEPLGHITSLLNKLSNPEVLREGDLPWIVNLYDLMVISDTLKSLPPFLLHYIERRVRVSNQSLVSSHDELDMFGHYLETGLSYNDVTRNEEGEKIDSVHLLTHTTKFDEYYFYQLGIRKTRSPKPQPNIAFKYKQLIQKIVACGIPGRVNTALAFLDLDEETRKKLLEFLVKVVKRSKKKERTIGTLMGGHSERDEWMIALYVGEDCKEVQETLKQRCDQQVKRFGVNRIYGVGFQRKKRKLEICSIYNIF